MFISLMAKKSWDYLQNHRIFRDEYGISRFNECLDIEFVLINPIKRAIDDDKKKNIFTEYWLECGPYDENCRRHDIYLDCGSHSFDIAIIKLARLVHKRYDKRRKYTKIKASHHTSL